MASYPIIPSLSRSPDFATSRKIEDGTISDPKESGYVSTRPRFTRRRRTWGVAWKNLVSEDVRVLDKFEVSTVKGGAGAFYLPNLVPNGGFEFPPTLPGELVSGWKIQQQSPAVRLDLLNRGANAATAGDGVSAIVAFPQPCTLAPGNSPSAAILSSQSFPVDIGDVFAFDADLHLLELVALNVEMIGYWNLNVSYEDGTTQYPGAPYFTTATTGFAPQAVTIPAPVDAGTIRSTNATVAFSAFLVNTTNAPIVIDGSVGQMVIDNLAVALISAANPYGRMPGTSSPGCAVRFTKPITIKDAKPADGVKRYDVTCEVTEL